MKKTLFTFLLMTVMAVTAHAQEIGEQMYIYYGDRVTGGFLPSEIDSIAYSYYDEDGFRYDDVVTQVIYTADSVYKIPIEEIDSVSFVRPRTIYKSGVIVLEGEIRQYIINSDGYNLTLSPNTPSILMPKVGDRLVTMKPDEQFPYYFAGEVTSISSSNGGYEVVCNTLDFEDVVDQFADIIYAGTENAEESLSPAKISISKRAGIPWTPISLPSYQSSADLGLSVTPIPEIHDIETNIDFGAGFKYSIVPEARARITWFIMGGLYVNAMMVIDNNFSWSHHFCGSVSANSRHSFLPSTVEIKIGPSPFNLYFDCGWFANLSGSLVWEGSVERKTRTTLSFIYDRAHPENNTASRFTQLLSSSDDATRKLYGDISAEAGLYIEAGFDLVRAQILKVGFRADIGINGSASNLRLWNGIRSADSSSQYYDNIKDGEISLTPFVRFGGVWGVAEDLPYIGASGNFLQNTFSPGAVYKAYAVPTFDKLKAERPDWKSTTVMASAALSQRVFVPVGVGFTAVNENKERVSTDYLPQTYSDHNMFPDASRDLRNVPLSGKYKVKPMLRMFGFEVMASPEVSVAPPVKITEFKQTGSEYKKGGFSHNGRTYDYKYDVAVTVEIESTEGVSDWGYVYKDPDGQIAHISLKNYGSSYTDKRYVYYRNESPSTVTLYGYVKPECEYGEEGEYVYGDPEDYTVQHSLTYCPDNNHPHMIDLGLPSGTKWACCNVGADKPESYGGYYAWGETEEKSVYNEVTYQYCTGEDTDGDGWYDRNEQWQIIGSDIAGTSYDVAHVKWGGSWVMPSVDQQIELMGNCTYEWTTLNGVKGGKFTGKNGGTIFLPAAGYRWNDGLLHAGSNGYFWSSTQNPSSTDYAYDMGFNSSYAYWYYDGRRHLGHTVRPVSR